MATDTDDVPGADVDIVIVNWNSRSLLRECLSALDQSTIADMLSVIIVDNASTDGSADGLLTRRVRVDLVRNAENRGFAAACNQGAARGQAAFILFLNPDVRVGSDTIANAARYLDDPVNCGVGILGVQLVDPDGKVQRSCAREPTTSGLLLQSLFLDRQRLLAPLAANSDSTALRPDLDREGGVAQASRGARASVFRRTAGGDRFR